jgi:hypothetical protein
MTTIKKIILCIGLPIAGLQSCSAQDTPYSVLGEVFDFYEHLDEYTKRPVLSEYDASSQSIDTVMLPSPAGQYLALKSMTFESNILCSQSSWLLACLSCCGAGRRQRHDGNVIIKIPMIR